jgi:hypothetical protein
MALPLAKFPRRHAQRQALRQRNKASVSNLRSREQRQRHKPRNTRNKRVGYHGHIHSNFESDSDVDVDTDKEEDSRYSSNGDDEAEYLNEFVEQFRAMGPEISNLGEVAQEMIQTEQRIFQKCQQGLYPNFLL